MVNAMLDAKQKGASYCCVEVIIGELSPSHYEFATRLRGSSKALPS